MLGHHVLLLWCRILRVYLWCVLPSQPIHCYNIKVAAASGVLVCTVTCFSFTVKQSVLIWFGEGQQFRFSMVLMDKSCNSQVRQSESKTQAYQYCEKSCVLSKTMQFVCSSACNDCVDRLSDSVNGVLAAHVLSIQCWSWGNASWYILRQTKKTIWISCNKYNNWQCSNCRLRVTQQHLLSLAISS